MSRKDDYRQQIVTGRICPYCGRKTVLVDSAEIYGRSYGMIYLCRPCQAYVGCHKGTTRALGRLANSELREAKHQAHEVFDRVWKEKIISRHEAYRLLAEELGIDPDYAHIGMLDADECREVVRIFTKVYDDLNNGMSGSTTTWVEPYLRWDATLDQIKADMATQGWTAQVSEGNILQYSNSKYPGVTMNMGVLSSRTNTLSTTQVAYMNVPSDFFNKILNEVVTRYNVTWENTGRIYSGKGVANDKDVSITVTNAVSTVLVQFVRR